MQFRVLGSLEVCGDDGSVVELGGAQPRLVLAMLLAAEGRVVPVDSLIEAVWGDDVPPSASGTLQSYVSRLRRILDNARSLRWEPPGYRLDIAADAVDFRRFEQLAESGRAALEAGEPESASAVLNDALALWRGRALVEFAEHEFARGLVTRLEERRFAAIEDRIDAELALGRHAMVVGDLTQLVREHPLRERFGAQLALALYRSGRQADALRALDQLRTTLLDELGVDPSRPVRDLEAQILDQDPALDGPDRSALPPPATATVAAPAAGTKPEPASAEPSIVGRRAEVDQLAAALRDTVAGRARFAIVEGEPGIGKTRLLEELSAMADAAGARVCWGRCREDGAAPAFWPWLEVLRPLAESADGVLDPQLEQLLARTAEPSEAATDRFLLFDAVMRFVSSQSRVAPLVIVLDDIQWADRASLELLSFLASYADDAAILLAVSVRDLDLPRSDEVVDALVAVSRRPGARRLVLSGLGERDTAVLVERATGVTPTNALVRAIQGRADGNPFFSGELARLVVAEAGGREEELVRQAAVPAGVRDVVRRRVARLPEATLELLQAGAVIGRDAPLDQLVLVAEIDVEQCLEDLEPAMTNRLLAEVPGVIATFRFSHALVREVVLDDLPKLQRARLHQRCALALMSTGGNRDDNAEIVATHLWEALPLGDRRLVADALVRASDVAMRRFAYESAEAALRRAVELKGWADDDDGRDAEFNALSKYSMIRRLRYGYASVLTPEFERARFLAREIGKHDELHHLLWAEWAAFSTACQLDVAERLAAEMYENSYETDDLALRAGANAARGIQCWHTGRITEAAAFLDEAHALMSVPEFVMPQGSALVEQLVLAIGFRLAMHQLLDDMPDNEAQFAAARNSLADPFAKIVIDNFDSYAALASGNAVRAARIGRRSLATPGIDAIVFFGSAIAMFLAWAQSELGEHEEALALYEEHLPRYRSTGILTCVALHMSVNGLIVARVGRFDEVDQWMAAADQLIEERGERWQEPYISLHKSEIAHLRGDRDTAAAELRKSFELAARQGNASLVHQAEQAAARLGVALQ